MPFTFSHPAIVLPLRFLPHHWFSLSGLVIGSLAPDFEYFIRIKIRGSYGHSIAGVFWFDLPLVILLTFLFHNVVRNSLVSNLPHEISGRFIGFNHFNYNAYFKRNWYIVIISGIIGVFSHLFWDAFTHQSGYFVQHISPLETRLLVFGKQIPAFKFLQHLSTFFGGLAIFYAIYKMPKAEQTTIKPDLKYWFLLVIITITILSLRIIVPNDIGIGDCIASAIAASLVGLIVTPLFLKSKLVNGNLPKKSNS